MKKKVLIFSTAYLPLVGGAEIAIKEITDRLAADFEFDLICARIRKDLLAQEKIGSVNVWRVGSGRWGRLDKLIFSWRGFKLAKRLYVKQKYDLVWAVMASFGGLAALLFKEQFSGVPYVLTLQEGDSPAHIRSRSRWLGRYYRKVFAQADHLTAISRFLKDYALENGAVSPIEVVPNGVDINKFSVLSVARDPAARNNLQFSKEKFKNRLGIKNGEKIIITVSRLVKKNGVGDLIEAMVFLPENHKLLILGSGALERGLKSKVKNSKLDRKILFLGEILPDEVPKYLAIADVFVRPSLSEGLGNVFLEAMAAGVPIIGTAVGGIPDFLKDPSNDSEGATGIFCQVNNPVDLAEKIRLLFQNEELREKLIINGQKLVEEKYDWDKIAWQIRNVFKKFI